AARYQGGHLYPGPVRRGQDQGLERDQHEEGLEAFFCFREMSRHFQTTAFGALAHDENQIGHSRVWSHRKAHTTAQLFRTATIPRAYSSGAKLQPSTARRQHSVACSDDPLVPTIFAPPR